VFDLVASAGEISEDDMWSTFNMGLGMVLVVPGEHATDVVQTAREAGHEAHVVGRLSPPAGVRPTAFGSS
jgi:phosphoribosylformylglycinamidine cyclo-ligase